MKKLLSLVVALLAIGVSSIPADAQTENGELVDAAFAGLLGRAADSAGRAFWISQLDSGIDPRTVVARIGNAPEQREYLVKRGYREILGRGPEAGGLAFWSQRLLNVDSSRSLYSLIFGSDEFFAKSGGTNGGFVDQMYAHVLNRPSEPAGRRYWLGRLDTDLSRVDVAAAFLASPEAILQPSLSIASSTPRDGAVAQSFGFIEVELDRPIVAEASTILVSLNGQFIEGTVSAGADDRTLRFAPAGLPVGTKGRVVVTVFAYDGDEVNHVDYRFDLNLTNASLNELMVAYYGHAKTGALGILGETPPEQALARLQAQAAPYAASGRPVMPVFELIATLVTANPGADGLYRSRTEDAAIRPWLEAIRGADGRLILDIQPGRASFIDEAMAYESLLLEPEVGLALDPEWVVGPNQTPKGRVGTTDAADINLVSAYLADLVLANDLPDKVLIIHRFRPDMVTNTDAILTRPGVIILFHADGEGGPAAKLADYFNLMPPRFARGIKLFFDEDTRLMSAEELLALDPQPDFVSYQ